MAKRLHLVARKGILSIKELQFSGRKRMSVNQYLIGNNIETGIILGE